MDVKIGILDSPRELVIDTKQAADEVHDAITAALGKSDGVLQISDKRGRQYLVPVKNVAYVEIGEGEVRRVGFAAGD